jgi:hypothetical protein
MARSLELKLTAQILGTEQAQKLADAIQKIGQNSKISEGEFKLLDLAISSGIKSGQSLDEALKQVGQSAKSVGKDAAEAANALRDALKPPTNPQNNPVQPTVNSMKELLQLVRGFSLTSGLTSGLGGIFALSALSSPVGALGVGLGLLTRQVKELVTGFADEAREQENLSSKTGLSLQQSRLFTQVSKLAGTEVNSLVISMRSLSRAMAENSDEGKKAKAALAELGLGADVAFQTPERAFERIAAKLKDRPAFERERLATEIFSRGGTALLPLIDHYEEIQKKLQPIDIITDEEIKQAAEFRQDLDLIGIQWDILKGKFASKLITTIDFVSGGESLAPSALAAIFSVLATKVGIKAPPARPNVNDLPVDSFGNFKGDYQTGKGGQALRPPDVDPIAALKAGRSAEAAQLKDLADRQFGGKESQRLRTKEITEEQTALNSSIERYVNLSEGSSAAEIRLHANRIAGLRAAIQLQGDLENITKSVFNLTQQASFKPFGEIGQVLARREEFLRPISEKISEARATGNTNYVKELQAQFDAASKAFDKELDDVNDKQQGERIKTRVQGVIEDLQEQFRHAGRVEEHSADRKDTESEYLAINQQLRDRLQLLQLINEQELKEANRPGQTFEQQQNAVQAANDKYKRDVDKANNEAEEQGADVGRRKREREEAAEEADRKRKQEADRSIIEIGINERRREAETQARRAERQADLVNGPGNEARSISQAYQIRIGLANQLHDIDLNAANQIEDAEKRRVEIAKIEATLRRETGDAALDRELKILELRRKQTDEVRNVAGELYRGLRSGPKGLLNTVTGIGDKLGEHIFQNLAEEAFKGLGKPSFQLPGQGTAQNPNFLGKLLRGTGLGIDQAKAAENLALTANTSTTTLNTAATQSLTAAIQGLATRAGGSGGSVFGNGGGQGASSSDEGGEGGAGGDGSDINSLPIDSGYTHYNPSGVTGGGGSLLKNIGKIAGYAGAVAAGVFGVKSGIQTGGAKGGFQIATSVLGTAAALDPEPLSRAILGIAALGTSLIGGLFGDPRKNREKQLSSELQGLAYVAPKGVNLTVDSSGRGVDTDFKDRLRVLGGSPTASFYNQITGFDPNNFGHLMSTPQRQLDVSSSFLTPNSSSAAPTIIHVAATIPVHAFDSKSIEDHAPAIGNAVMAAIQAGHKVAGAIKNSVKPY